MRLASFKPPILNQSTLQRLRDFIGRVEWKQQPYRLLVELSGMDPANSRTTTSRSRLNSNRQRIPSSNKKPAEIYIELCEDEVMLIDRKTYNVGDRYHQL